MLLIKTPVPHHITIFLNAIVNQLKVLCILRDDEFPEELRYLLLEPRISIFDVLAKLAQAAELLHVELFKGSMVSDHVKDEVKMPLFVVEGAI